MPSDQADRDERGWVVEIGLLIHGPVRFFAVDPLVSGRVFALMKYSMSRRWSGGAAAQFRGSAAINPPGPEGP